MLYRIHITVEGYGSDEHHAELFLDALTDRYAEGGPVVSQNTEDGTLTVAFALGAASFDEVAQRASQVFTDSANATGLPATDVLSAQVELIERAESPEPVPA